MTCSFKSMHKVRAYLKITKLFNLRHSLPTLLAINIYNFHDFTLNLYYIKLHKNKKSGITLVISLYRMVKCPQICKCWGN